MASGSDTAFNRYRQRVSKEIALTFLGLEATLFSFAQKKTPS